MAAVGDAEDVEQDEPWDHRDEVDDVLQRAAGRRDPAAVRSSEVEEPGGRYIDFLVPGLLGMGLMGGGLWGLGFVTVDLRIRKLLKRKYGLETDRPTGITAVYSIEPRRQPASLKYDTQTDGFLCVCPHKANEFHTCDHRTQIDGSAVFVTSAFGMNCAGVAVRRIAAGR